LDTTEKYLVVVLTLLFVLGICLLIATVREQSGIRKQWDWRG
jgi:hypothetical protein